MQTLFIRCVLLIFSFIVGGCIDASSRNKTEEVFYSSGSLLYSVEMRRVGFEVQKQRWEPHGLTVFWNRDGSVLKIENYMDGTLCGPYLEFFPFGGKRVVAHLSAGAVRKRWKEFDENGICVIDEDIVGWNVRVGANGRSNIPGKMVPLSDLYQDPENKLFFHKNSGLLYSGIVVIEESDDGTVRKSHDFIGGERKGVFTSDQ